MTKPASWKRVQDPASPPEACTGIRRQSMRWSSAGWDWKEKRRTRPPKLLRLVNDRLCRQDRAPEPARGSPPVDSPPSFAKRVGAHLQPLLSSPPPESTLKAPRAHQKKYARKNRTNEN
jgi:hypothetical protein